MKKNPTNDNKNKFGSSFFKRKKEQKENTVLADDVKSITEEDARPPQADSVNAPDISGVKAPEADIPEAESKPGIPAPSVSAPPAEELSAENKDNGSAEPKKKSPSFISAVLNKVKSLYTGQEQTNGNGGDTLNAGADGTEPQEGSAAAKKPINKKLIIGISAGAFLVIAAVVIIILISGSGTPDGTAYVTPVSELNTAVKSISGNRFSGVVEAQKTYDIKLEADRSIKEVYVNEGDAVEEGDELFLYDVEAMELELENGELEIESLQNDIDSAKRQISELESEKENAGKDNQLSYTTQIQSLKTDIEKIEYDIKVKDAAQEKLQAAIENAVMTAPSSGTVKSLKTIEQMQEEGTDTIMNIVADGDFRIKGRINEQNIGSIIEGDAVLIRSRVDDEAVWKGIVTEISNEPESNNNNFMYGMDDSENTSSNYAFYITPESIEGLMLGQHVLIEPDTGMNSGIEKDGIWLYEDYINDIDTGEPYVWAVDNSGRLEKRMIETGERDEENGDIEIVSGLDNDDLIAYPSDDYQEGMKTSNKADEELEAELNGNDMNFMPDGGFGGDMDLGYGIDGADGDTDDAESDDADSDDEDTGDNDLEDIDLGDLNFGGLDLGNLVDGEVE